MSNPQEIYQRQAPEGVNTASDIIIITASATALARPVRALRVVGAGNLTITTFAGNTRVVAFRDGETRYIGATHVTAVSGPTVVEGLV